VFTVVAAAIFMSNLDLFIVNVALPSIGRDFGGSSLAGLSWVLNAYAIVFAALLVPAGRLGDRTGQRRVFLAGIAIFTLAPPHRIWPSWSRRGSCRPRAPRR
jgi:MFS family permease